MAVHVDHSPSFFIEGFICRESPELYLYFIAQYPSGHGWTSMLRFLKYVEQMSIDAVVPAQPSSMMMI